MVVDDTATPTEGKEEEEEEEEGVRSGGGWVDSSSLQTAGRPAREESGRCWGFSPRSINVDPPSSPLLPTCWQVSSGNISVCILSCICISVVYSYLYLNVMTMGFGPSSATILQISEPRQTKKWQLMVIQRIMCLYNNLIVSSYGWSWQRLPFLKSESSLLCQNRQHIKNSYFWSPQYKRLYFCVSASERSKVHCDSPLVYRHSHQSPPLSGLLPPHSCPSGSSVAVAPGKAGRTLTSPRTLPNVGICKLLHAAV